MKLLVHATTGQVYAASDVAGWQVPPFAIVVDYPGNAESYAWPPGGPTSSLFSGGRIIANPDAPAPVDVLTVDELAAALKQKGVIVEADLRKG